MRKKVENKVQRVENGKMKMEVEEFKLQVRFIFFDFYFRLGIIYSHFCATKVAERRFCLSVNHCKKSTHRVV